MDATFWAPFLRITSVILGIITAGSVADAYYSSSTVFFLRSSMWRGYKTAPGFYHYRGASSARGSRSWARGGGRSPAA